MLIPKPRGAFSEELFATMRGWPDEEPSVRTAPDDLEDAAIALWALYELHYRGFDDADDRLEWDPALLQVRRGLEEDLERRLRERYTPPEVQQPFAEAFFDFVSAHEGPSLARFVQRRADQSQVMDLLRMRSVYHLKESDPVTWAIPRLPTAAKAALVELQYDEYGDGDPNRLHAHLFARGLESAGLRSEYGAYVDEVPGEVLEQNNAMSLFGLHRRLRGAALGHLAAFEVTSPGPSRRMVRGLQRLGFADEMIAYYEEHVEADAVHEQLAVRTICAALVDAEPSTAADVWFGAFTCLDLEDRLAGRVLATWGEPA
jgi:hypothetical protein